MRGFRFRAAGVVVLFVVVVAVLPAAAAPTGWRVVPSPNLPGGDNVLNGVSCATRRSCIAVGYVADALNTTTRTLAETWNGAVWTVVPSPSPGFGARLTGVSCVAPKSCVAVGTYAVERAGSGRTLVESWDGRTWSIVPSSNKNVVSADGSPSPSSRLDAVSCTTRRSCVAVGEYFFYPYNSCTYGLGRTLTEVWDGNTWTIVPSPDPATSLCHAITLLDAVSCSRSKPQPGRSDRRRRSSCVAVGYTRDEGGDGASRTVTETWDGRAWTLVPSPNPGAMSDYRYPPLTGVSCVTSKSCVAVGEVHDAARGTHQTLVESWDGHAWTLVPSPNPSTFTRPLNVLSGVSCATARSCSAVGWYGATDNGTGRTLVETWNGTAWNVSPSPSRGTSSQLNSVSCPRPASCLAVGENSTNTFSQTLVLSGGAKT